MTRQAPSTALTDSRYSVGIYGITFLENNFILPHSKGGVGKKERPQGSPRLSSTFQSLLSPAGGLEGWAGVPVASGSDGGHSS